MSAGTEQSTVDAIKFDLRLLHETWMETVYPRQRGADGTVLGKWEPDGGLSLYLYKLWSGVGVPIVGLLYPLVLFGYFIRFQTRRLNVTAVRLGFVGVVGLFVLLWGALAVLVRFQFSGAFVENGVVAIVAASGVGILSSALAYGTWRLGGRFTTVLFAYPLAMTAIFLPPVVAGLYSEAVGSVVLSSSDSIQDWLIANSPSAVDSVRDYLIDNFDLEGITYVFLWFGISVPLGWILGIVVTLADFVRPAGE
jgi:hypothetical protein